jgi:hypothetical protein
MYYIMSVFCPICRQEILPDLLFRPLLGGPDLHALGQKINPGWELSDGCCEACLSQMGMMLGGLRSKPETSSSEYANKNYRYHLTQCERKLWNHPVSETREAYQIRIIARISKQASSEGCLAWLIFDINEVVVAQSPVQES